jgi:choline dehydrogenase-like flavoprotein
MSSPYDMLVMRQAFETSLDFTGSETWKSYLGAPINGLGPVIEALKTNNSSVFEDFVRNNVENGAHAIGTSSMSPVGAPWGVVDPELRVKGIQGLRVVDASVFVCILLLQWPAGLNHLGSQPFVLGGHTQIPTYCLAERAADIIKGFH